MEKEKDNLWVDTEKGTPKTPETDNSQEDLTKERWKQQMEWSKAEAERLKKLLVESEKEKASQDANSLLDLHSKDPKLANDVAKEFWYNSFDEAKKIIDRKNAQWVENKEQIEEDDFDAKYEKRRAKEEHEKALKKAEKELSLIKDENLKEEAIKRFNFLIEWRQLKEETALEFAEMATLYVNKDNIKWARAEEKLADLASIWISKSKPWTITDDEYVVRDGKLVLKSNKSN